MEVRFYPCVQNVNIDVKPTTNFNNDKTYVILFQVCSCITDKICRLKRAKFHTVTNHFDVQPCIQPSWWRNQMETFSASLAICAGNSPVPGEFPTQRPVTRSFDVFFDLCPNKQLSKQWWGWWFGTQSSCPLWRHSNDKERHTTPSPIHVHTRIWIKVASITFLWLIFAQYGSSTITLLSFTYPVHY